MIEFPVCQQSDVGSHDLDRGLLAEAGPDWHVADFPPGGHPLAALTGALVKAINGTFSDEERAVIGARLARGPRGLIEWLDEIRFPPGANLLLLVDQFEELFRYRRGDASDEAEAFVALLLASARQRERRIYVVITMRSDFLGDCAQFFGLADAINDGQFLTPRLTRQQCQQAIEGPATVYDGNVEKVLVTRLLNDMGSNPDQLPLMQHILMLMWQNARERNPTDIVLTLADYEDLGGIGSGASADSAGAIADSAAAQPQAEGALSKHADQTLRELTSEQQRLRRMRPTLWALYGAQTGENKPIGTLSSPAVCRGETVAPTVRQAAFQPRSPRAV